MLRGAIKQAANDMLREINENEYTASCLYATGKSGSEYRLVAERLRKHLNSWGYVPLVPQR